MSERPVYLTREGLAQLQAELEELRTVRRHKVAQRLHDALEEGELIENAELEDARREQAFVEGRIFTLEQTLRNVLLIDEVATKEGYVNVGSYVTIQEEGTSAPEEYQVVGSAEAAPTQGKISNESPLGRALLGKRVGEQAVVRAPDGDIVFRILAVR